MPVLRLTITERLVQRLRAVAASGNEVLEEFAVGAVENEVERRERGGMRRALSWFAGPLATAVAILALLVIFGQLLGLPALLGGTYYDPHAQGLDWLRVFLATLFPWPVTIIIIAWLFFSSRTAFSNLLDLFGLFRRFKVFGAEVELSDRTRRKIQEAAGDISAAIGAYRKGVDGEAARLVSRFQLQREIERLVEDSVYPLFGREALRQGGFRCTIHVPDPVLEGHLYQLVGYHPGGGGVARSFSVRYGIIGKVWRSEQSMCVNNLLPDLPADASLEERIARVTQDWGMTRAEAERVALSRPSYVCVLLEDEGTKVGTFYMDCEKPEAFSKPLKSLEGMEGMSLAQVGQKIAAHIQDKATQQFAKKVGKLLDELASVGLHIDIGRS